MDIDFDIATVSLKPMRCEQNALKKPDGSVNYWEGDTNVLVAVYGPADCKESKRLTNKCCIEVSLRPKIGIPGVAEKYFEHTIRSILETVVLTALHPRSMICIVVQIMQDKGSLLSCCINAVSMALQDAGISMRNMPAAVTVTIQKEVKKEDSEIEVPQKIILSPTTDNESNAAALLLFVFDSVNKNVICTTCKGSLAPSMYKLCLESSKRACEVTLQFYRDSICKTESSNSETRYS